jgi:hypothetical protein
MTPNPNLHDSLHDLASEATMTNLLPQVHRTSRTLHRRRAIVRLAVVAAVAVAAITAAPSLLPDRGPSTTPAGPSTSPRASLDLIGSDGYGGLKLGMTLAEAMATGELSDTISDEVTCVEASLLDFPDARVWIDKERGVAVIDIVTGMETTEGVGPDSTVAEARAAYPDFEQTYTDVLTVPLGGDPAAKLTIALPPAAGAHTKIDGLSLSTVDQACLN